MKHVSALASLLCATGFIVTGVPAVAQDADLQQAVDQFYPTERLNPSDASERYSCYGVLDGSSTEQPALVIAAYTDQSNGAVRVLRRNDAGVLEVVYDNPDVWMLRGTRCTVRLRDVDFDDEPEAFVYFRGTRASPGWIFRWDGSALVNLTPTRLDDGRELSLLLDPVVYDLEHDGTLRVVASREIATRVPGQRPRNPAYVYRLGPTGFEVEKSILGVMGFRADVDPSGNVRSFRLVEDSFPPFTLRVINGDRSGQNRVSGASIRVNEVEVIGPQQVNVTTEFTDTVLTSLFVENRLTVTLTGPPDAIIIVLVEDSTQR